MNAQRGQEHRNGRENRPAESSKCEGQCRPATYTRPCCGSENRLTRIHRPYGLLDGFHHGLRVQGGTDGQRHGFVRHLLKRCIDGGLGLLFEAVVMDLADDPHHFPELSPQAQAPANGIIVGPILAREGFVDQDDWRRFAVIAIGKKPATQ